MIKSKEDYHKYLDADRIALGIRKRNFKILFNLNYIWNFQKKLRKIEYYANCKKGFLNKLYYYYLKYRFKKESIRLGFTIPQNVFGPGLAIVHHGTIIVSNEAKIGKNCRIHAGVNIGASGGMSEAPIIGDNVYIGPGAVIYGGIKIGDNIAIGANSTVNKSFDENNILIAGSPAEKQKTFDISRIIKHVDKNSLHSG